MNILSLFDGISCGQLALKRAGISVNKYYASEINPHSIKITLKNFPNTICLGDVTKLIISKIETPIDCIIAGSPCENLSITACDRSNVYSGLAGQKSKLFFNFLNILKLVNPKYFMLENVASMTEDNKKIISDMLNISPILIDSADFSAQERKRLYWTNIPIINFPNKNTLVLKDILETTVDSKYFYNKPFEIHPDKRVIATLQVNTTEMCKRIYSPNYKCATLTAVRGGYQEKKILLNDKVRKLTPIEYERLQTLPDNYTEGISQGARYSSIGDGWTVDVIAHIFKGLK